MCDFGTGNNNKMNFVERNRQDVINILEAVYRGATKGKGQVNSPKGQLTSLFFGMDCFGQCVQRLTHHDRLFHTPPILEATTVFI